MNRSTVIMVVVLGALIAVWALSGDKREAKRELPALVVEGFLKKEISLQDIKIYNKDEESPYTRYVVEKAGASGPERYEIVLDPKTAGEKKAENKVWWVTRTYAGGKKTMKVRAENYRLRMYNQLLARNFRSSYAFKAEDKDLSEYGLDPAHAIKVVAVSPQQTVKLVIGSKHEMESGGAATWVMNPDVPGVVYQISGFDLRTNFDAPWKDIRDRKILSINPGRIHRVELVNPRVTRDGQAADRVVLERPKLTADQLKKLAKAKKWDEVRKAAAGWKMSSPTGFDADGDEIGSWLESLERMTATEYFDLTGGKLPENTGLDDDKRGVQVKLFDGDKVVELVLGDKNPKGTEQDIFVQVKGHDDEIYTVAGWMGDQIVMDRDKLRDRRLLKDRKGAEVVKLVITSSGERFEAERAGDTWRSKSSIDPKNVTDFLSDLDGIRVEWKSQISRAAANLTKPKTQIELTWADGHSRTLLVAVKKSDKGYAAFTEGDVFEVPSWNAGRLHRRPRDFADKHVLPIPVDDVVAITLPAGGSAGAKGSAAKAGANGATATLTRTSAGWKASNGAKLDQAAVQALLQSLRQSTYHQQVDDKPANVGLAPPAYALQVKAKDGRTYGLRLSTKVLENNPYGAMLENGKVTRVFSISAMMAPMLQRSVDDLKPGKKGQTPGPAGAMPGGMRMPPGMQMPGAHGPAAAAPAPAGTAETAGTAKRVMPAGTHPANMPPPNPAPATAAPAAAPPPPTPKP